MKKSRKEYWGDTIKILWVSDSPLIPTGYANVTRNIIKILKEGGHDTRAYGFQYHGNALDGFFSDGFNAFPLYPSFVQGEFFGEKGSLETYIKDLQPNMTCFLCDSFMIQYFIQKRIVNDKITTLAEHIKENIKTKFLFYFPFDSNEVYAGADEVLKVMDIRVAMSRFGQKVLKRDTGMDSHYIPHAVDVHKFRPLNKDMIENFKKTHELDGKFIIGYVGRNQTRKLPSRLMEAFALFAKNKKDVMLLLHCDPRDPMGNNLYDLSKKLGIEDKIKFSGMKSPLYGMREEDLNMLYNVMDIHAMATTGEGFGLTTIEAMACGVPNVLTDYTTSRELIKGCGELAKIKTFLLSPEKNTRRALVDIEDMADRFDKLYNKPKLREKYAKIGMKRVLKNYTWERVGRMWLRLFDNVV